MDNNELVEKKPVMDYDIDAVDELSSNAINFDIYWITKSIVKIALGQQRTIYLPDLSFIRNWGSKLDYVEILELNPQVMISESDFKASVRDLIRICFAELGIEIEFSGKLLQERGVIIDREEEKLNKLGIDPDSIKIGQTVVKVDSDLFTLLRKKSLITDSDVIDSKNNTNYTDHLLNLVSKLIFEALNIIPI